MQDIKEILMCMEIQIEKLENALDMADQKYTEMVQATDAIRFDFNNLKKRINERANLATNRQS